jgi:hypothetical protein
MGCTGIGPGAGLRCGHVHRVKCAARNFHQMERTTEIRRRTAATAPVVQGATSAQRLLAAGDRERHPSTMATTATPSRPSGSRALGGVLANPGIRRVEIAWTAGLAADWAYLVVLLVVAYEAGGPVAVGLLGLVRMVPTILLGAIVPEFIERTRRDRALVEVHAVRAFAALGTAAAIATGLPLLVTFLLAAVATGAGTLVRPIQTSLMPALARTPEELVASNVASSSGEGVGTFAGPLIGGLVLATAGPAWACGVIALIAFGSTAALGRMHWAIGVRGPDRRRTSPQAGLGTGIRALAGHRTAAVIVGAFVGQSFVRGLMNTLLVVASIQLLGLGEGGVGLLNTAIGAGGFVGALIALGLATRPRIAPAFAVALAMWSLPLVVIGFVSVPVLAIAALVVTGTSNAVLDVAGFTLMQRGLPGGSRMAVFGLLESVAAIGVALGSVTAPILLATAGSRGALIISGLSLPLLALATWPPLSRTTDASTANAKVTAILRKIPLFEPLGLTAMEALAADARPVRFEPGDVLMAQGDPGDRYIVIEAGEAEVTSNGRLLRTCGPGEGVGEIALLRRVPRTATVKALTRITGYALDEPAFLDAVAVPASSSVAALVIADRLARSSEVGGSPPQSP